MDGPQVGLPERLGEPGQEARPVRAAERNAEEGPGSVGPRVVSPVARALAAGARSALRLGRLAAGEGAGAGADAVAVGGGARRGADDRAAAAAATACAAAVAGHGSNGEAGQPRRGGRGSLGGGRGAAPPVGAAADGPVPTTTPVERRRLGRPWPRPGQRAPRPRRRLPRARGLELGLDAGPPRVGGERGGAPLFPSLRPEVATLVPGADVDLQDQKAPSPVGAEVPAPDKQTMVDENAAEVDPEPGGVGAADADLAAETGVTGRVAGREGGGGHEGDDELTVVFRRVAEEGW